MANLADEFLSNSDYLKQNLENQSPEWNVKYTQNLRILQDLFGKQNFITTNYERNFYANKKPAKLGKGLAKDQMSEIFRMFDEEEAQLMEELAERNLDVFEADKIICSLENRKTQPINNQVPGFETNFKTASGEKLDFSNKKVAGSSNTGNNGNQGKTNNGNGGANAQTEQDDQARQNMFDQIASVQHKKIHWTDIGGLKKVKTRLKEAIIQPLLRPDLFEGNRSPPKGVLLFGPPGNGKTLLAQCIATELSKYSVENNSMTDANSVSCVFLTVHTTDIMSKWMGESEKQVKALFEYAKENQPAVIFIDEIDSIFQKRTDDSKVADVRIINEFLTRIDGVSSNTGENNVYIIGATNRPQMIDDAALRRLTLKFYVPLPDEEARSMIARRNLSGTKYELNEEAWKDFGVKSEGYSGDDIAKVVNEATLVPLRKAIQQHNGDIMMVDKEKLPLLMMADILEALNSHKPTAQNLEEYQKWGKRFGANFE